MKPAIRLFLLLGALALGRAGVAAEVEIAFLADATVRGSAIHLGDVARIVCRDPRLARTVSETEIGQAPPVGGSRAVSADYVRIRLRARGLRDAQFALQGPATVAVTRPGQRLSGATLERAACAAVEAARPGCAVQADAPVQDLMVSCGMVEAKAAEPVRFLGEHGRVAVQVWVDGRPEALVPVGVRLLSRAAVVVARRPLAAGSVIEAGDVQVEERPVAPGGRWLAETALAIGKRLNAAVAAGSPLNAGALQTVPLIRYGDRVKVVCRGAGFSIACAAEALQEGAVGQTIRVRNVVNRLEFTARVAGPDLLEVIY